MRWRRTTACERAAQWISLELDGEIAGLERAALARHLQRCDHCRFSRAEIGAFTRELREAPADGPAWPVTIVVPRRRLQAARAGLAALAATAAIAGGLAVFSASTRPSGGAVEFVTSQEQQAFAQEHVSMEPTLFVVPAPLPGSFGSRALL